MTKFNEFIVGVVFFIAIGVLGYYTIVRGEFFQAREYNYGTVLFDDVEGLSIGDKVLVNGVACGTVDAIELISDYKVIVSLKLYRSFNLYENYKITLKNQTALGGRIIVINPGAAEVKGQIYEPVESLKNLNGVAIGDPLTKISEVIDENRADIRIAIKNISEFTEKINKGQGTIAKLVNEDTLHKDADLMIKEMRDTIEDSREQAPVTSFIRAALLAF